MIRDDILVVELGFNSAKYICGAKKGRVPSAFRCKPGGYIYGEDAMVRTGFSYLKTPAELFRHYPQFIKLCRKLAGAQDRNVKLAIGLPARYINESKPGGDVYSLKRSLLAEGFDVVHVLPQAFGGIISFLTEKKKSKGNTIVVDIGFNTVIFTFFSEDGGEILYANTLTKRGISQLGKELVLPLIAHLSPFGTFTPLETSILMERGEVQYHFETIDIRSEVQQASEEYVKALFDEILGEIKMAVAPLPVSINFALLGGGAALLSRSLPSNMPFTILSEPEYANARGIGALASILFDGGKAADI